MQETVTLGHFNYAHCAMIAPPHVTLGINYVHKTSNIPKYGENKRLREKTIFPSNVSMPLFCKLLRLDTTFSTSATATN